MLHFPAKARNGKIKKKSYLLRDMHGFAHSLASDKIIDASRRVILSAMREWEQSLPCIKWRVKSDKDVDFVRFFKGDG